MAVSIINKCSKNIILKESSNESNSKSSKKLLKPNEKAVLSDNCSIFSLRTEEKSKKEKFKSSYIISLEAFYSQTFEEKEIVVKREEIKASFSPIVVYERLLPTDESLKPKYYSITDKEKLQKAYKKERIFDTFVFEPILLHTLSVEFYALIIIGIILGFIFSPLVSVIYFLCIYLFSLSIELISSKLVDTALNKIFKTKSSKDDIKKYFDESFAFCFMEKPENEDIKTDFSG